MSMRWRKVAGDLRLYRLQIGMILLVLVLGIAAVTAALNAQAILTREIATSYAAAASPDIALWFDQADAEKLAAVRAEDGVAFAGARRTATTRIAAKDGTWLLLRLTVLPDFTAQQVGAIHLHGGMWPAGEGAILVEQSAQSLLDARAGSLLKVRTPTGETIAVPFGGFVHDAAIAPSTQERMIYAYVTPATAASLGQNPRLDQILVKMEYRGTSADAADLAARLQTSLGKKAMAPLRADVLPAAHPHAGLMNAMLRVLGVVSGMAFACSAALAGTMAAAWMRREVRQVGIMKTLGARAHQIALQYLALIGPVVLLAIALAMPLGILLGRAIVAWYAESLNIDVAGMAVPARLSWLELALALAIPLVAVSLPVARAARMTARDAIQDAGIAGPSSAGKLASRLIRVPGHVRWAYAMRNSWRRPWRLLTMVFGLAAGGALLLLTHSNYESLMRVIDRSLANQGHDLEVQMQRAATSAALENVARAVPGVHIAEAWRRVGVSLETPISVSGEGGTGETRRLALTAYPDSTRLFQLPVVRGRMPRPGASDEILVTRTLQDATLLLQLDATVELQFRTRRQKVRVVGVVEEIGMPGMYANAATFDAVTGLGDAASLLRVKVDGDQVELVSSGLDRALMDAKMAPAQIFTRNMLRDSLDEHFKVVGDVIRMVALAAALIGGIMLAATTGLGILERVREIGVLRTLGATPRDIAALFWAEGASVTLLGFLLAVALSIPLTLAMLDAAEHRLLHVAVPLHFSWNGLAILGCGALVVLLTVQAVVSRSLRKTVRESLAYE